MAHFERDTTYSSIAAIVATQLNKNQSDIKPTSTFKELGADSLDMMQIVMKIEETFGMEINDADAEKMEHFDEVVNYVQERRTK